MPRFYFLFSPLREKRILLLIHFALLCSLYGRAQGKPVLFQFVKDTVRVTHGETFSNQLKVVNFFKDTLVLFKTNEDSHALISLPDTLRLLPGETKTFYVQYLASSSVVRAVGNRVEVHYREMNSPETLMASFILDQPDFASVIINPESATHYISSQTRQGSIQVRCFNKGYTSRQLRISLKAYPEGLQIQDNDKLIQLSPGEQQLLIFNVQNILSAQYTSDFSVSVSAQDLTTGKELAGGFTRLIVLGDEKRVMYTQALPSSPYNNNLQLSYRANHLREGYAQLSGWGRVQPFEKQDLRYQLNLNYYTGTYRGAEIFDSWVAYRNRYVGIHAGNISENLDYSLYGKGLKFSVFPDSSSSFSAYYVKQNRLIFSETNDPREGADTWAAQYQQTRGKMNTGLSFLNSYDPFTNLATNFGRAVAGWELKGDQSLEIEAGYSHEHLRNQRSKGRDGYAGGFRYRNRWGRFNLLSDNYYSSPYYSGLRRGALLLKETIDYQFSSEKRLFVDYEVIHNEPLYLANTYHAGIRTRTVRLQAGFSTRLNNHVALSVRNYLFSQGLDQEIFTIPFSLASRSWRGAAELSYHQGDHFSSLVADIGKVSTNNFYLSDNTYTSWQLRLNYQYKFAALNALVQHNPYYIIQEPSPWQQGNFRQYSFGPGFRFSFFQKRMEVEVYDNLSFYGYYPQGWSNAAQGRISFRFNKAWSAMGQVVYNSYTNYRGYNFFQGQISFLRSFLPRNEPGFRTVSLTFFGDDNANGVWDEGEPPVEDVVASFGNALAQSNRKGTVLFRNVKPAVYPLHIQRGNGWWLLTPLDVSVVRSISRNIALVKTTAVRGKIICEKDAYLDRNISLEGITVVALSEQGERFTTVTDGQGHFSFQLPVKPFHFSVRTDSPHQFFNVEHQSFDLAPENNPMLIFTMSDRSRKVEVQQF